MVLLSIFSIFYTIFINYIPLFLVSAAQHLIREIIYLVHGIVCPDVGFLGSVNGPLIVKADPKVPGILAKIMRASKINSITAIGIIIEYARNEYNLVVDSGEHVSAILSIF